MTKEQILNICKRIEENKATEEELCAIRDVALARSETGRTYEDGLEKAAAHVEAVAKSLSKGFERERDALELTASAIRYLKNAAPQVVSSSKATVPAQEAMAHGETGGPAESASPCVAVPILTPTRDDGSAAPHGE